MASIKIHQDIYNFERRRKGFTMRQIGGIAGCIAVIGAVCALLVYGMALPWGVSIAIATIFGLIPGFIGFVPVFNLPAEEFVKRWYDQQNRGSRLGLDMDSTEIEKGGISRVQTKEAKRRGFECRH